MPKPRSGRDHKYRHVTETVYRTPWAITPEKLNEILDVLDRRNALSADDPINVAAVAGFMDDDIDEEDDEYALTDSGVAVLSLSGIISQRMNLLSKFSGGTSTERFTRTFQKAMADPAVKAVVMDVNSPGGSIGGVAELSDVIFNARGSKPIVAVSNTQMCSAAYWIGSAADRVIASPSSNTGSIGVYMVHSEISKLDAKTGRTRTVVSAGKHKTVGNDVEPLSAEAKAKLQEFVSGAYALFLEAVARNRGTTVERVRHGYGEGDSLLAGDAVSAGLADKVASLAEVVSALGATGAVPSARAAMASFPLKTDSPVPSKGVHSMDTRILAALFARGLILDQTAAGEPAAQTALKAFFAGRRQGVPEGADAIVAGLMTQAAATATPLIATLAAKYDEGDEARYKKAATEAAASERHRAATIRARAKILGVEADGERLVEAGVADGAAIEQLFAAHTGKKGDNALPDRVEASASSEDKFASACGEVLLARASAVSGSAVTPPKLSAEAKDLAGMRLLDLAAESLRAQGFKIRGLSGEHIAKMALAGPVGIMQGGLYAQSMPTQAFYSTGNFANLALNASHKVLQRAFLEAPVSSRRWVRVGDSAPDFKPQSIVKMSAASDLEVVPEGQDTPTDTGLTDAREWYQVERFAIDIGFTFQMLVNDDLSALSRMPQLQGVAAARTFNKAVYKLLTSNPTMADGYALFDATNHQGNLLSGTGEVPSVASLGKMQAVLRKMKNLNTDSTLDLELATLLVPAELEASALALQISVTDPASNNPAVLNIFGPNSPKRQINVVEEALLSTSSAAYFYGIVDNSIMDVITMHFLIGQETPIMDSYWDPKKNTRFFQVSQVGAAVLEEYRGIVRDNGA